MVGCVCVGPRTPTSNMGNRVAVRSRLISPDGVPALEGGAPRPQVAVTDGTLRTHSPTFVTLTLGVALILALVATLLLKKPGHLEAGGAH